MTKKVTKQALIGERGVTLIKDMVLSMSSRWNPTESMDVGIDGTMELVDPDSGAALGALLAVQSRASEEKFKSETEVGFEWTCTEDDLAYWLQVNMPVLLIVSRPSARAAYWVCIQDHFRDADRRASKTAHFDKQRDRFDKSCFPALMRLGRSAAANQELLLLRGPIEVLGHGDLAQRAAVLTDPSKRAEAYHELENKLRSHGYPVQAFEVMGRRAEALIAAGKALEAADVWLELIADQLEFDTGSAYNVAIARLGERVKKLSAAQKAKVAAINARIDWQDLGRPAAPLSRAAKTLTAMHSPWAPRVLLWAAEAALVDDDRAEMALLHGRVKPRLGKVADASNLRLWLWHADATGDWDQLVAEAAAGRLADADAGLVFCRRGRWLSDNGVPDAAVEAFVQAAPRLARAGLMGDAAECHFSRKWVQLESGPLPSEQDQDAVARSQLRQRRRLRGERDCQVGYLESVHDGRLPRAQEFIQRFLWESVISGHVSNEVWARRRMGDLFARAGDAEDAVINYVLAGSADEARTLAATIESVVPMDLQRLRGRPHRLGAAIAVIGAQADFIPEATVRQVVPELLQLAHGVRQSAMSPTVNKEALDALGELSPMFSKREAAACLNLLAPAIPRAPTRATFSDQAIQIVLPTVWEHHQVLRNRVERMLLEALSQPDLAPQLIRGTAWIAERSPSLAEALRRLARSGNNPAAVALGLARINCPEATAEARRQAASVLGRQGVDKKTLGFSFSAHLYLAGQIGFSIRPQERGELAQKYLKIAQNRYEAEPNRVAAVLGLRYVAPLLPRRRQDQLFARLLELALDKPSTDSAFDELVRESQHPLSRTRLTFGVSSLMKSSLVGAAEMANSDADATKLAPLLGQALTSPDPGVVITALAAVGAIREDIRPAVDWLSWATHENAKIRAAVATLWTTSTMAPARLGIALAGDPARNVRFAIAAAGVDERPFGSRQEYMRARRRLSRDVSAKVRAAASSWA